MEHGLPGSGSCDSLGLGAAFVRRNIINGVALIDDRSRVNVTWFLVKIPGKTKERERVVVVGVVLRIPRGSLATSPPLKELS